MIRSFPWPLAVLALVASQACSPFKTDGESCPSTVCSSRGTCRYQNTFPTCACDPGYAGIVCSSCADGFHRASDDSCVADEVCTPGVCGANGTCQIDQGRVSCVCSLGYGGATCASCRAGYHGSGDGGCELDSRCTTSSCGDGGTCSDDAGRATCTCAADRSGAACEQRVGSCAVTNPCGANGRCTDADGVVRCVCDVGFGGPTCSTCYPGYRATDAGCVSAETCAPSSCSFVGTCSVDAGVTSCACDPGYTGTACSACATGYHRAPDYTCVVDQTCSANDPCSANGTCRVQAGATVCDCAAGFAGPRCDRCAPGFHADDAGVGCTLDSTCGPESCRFHGTCAADGGVVSCQCDPGFSGANCETNLDDCVNSACHSGTCIDLINANVCLCDGGVYGSVCP